MAAFEIVTRKTLFPDFTEYKRVRNSDFEMIKHHIKERTERVILGCISKMP